MSGVSYVPETHGLEGDDAWAVLRAARWPSLLRRSFVRFRYADGFSFARAVGFQAILTIIPGAIVLVAAAIRFDLPRLQRSIQEIAASLAPGPAGGIFRTAFQQGQQGARGETVAMILGAVVALVAGATAMSQIQRAATRIYGSDHDRPTVRRYALATGLAVSVGLFLTAAFVAISFGGSVTDALLDDPGAGWLAVRILGATLVLVIGIALLFKAAPNRDQPSVAWLAMGGLMATVLWLLLSALLTWYLNASSSFGQTYGPLAGFIGLAMWAQLSGIALLFGIAFAAELEAERAGVHEPRADDQPRTVTRRELFED